MWVAVALMMATMSSGCSSDENINYAPEPVIFPVDSDSILSNENNELRPIERRTGVGEQQQRLCFQPVQADEYNVWIFWKWRLCDT